MGSGPLHKMPAWRVGMAESVFLSLFYVTAH